MWVNSALYAISAGWPPKCAYSTGEPRGRQPWRRRVSDEASDDPVPTNSLLGREPTYQVGNAAVFVSSD